MGRMAQSEGDSIAGVNGVITRGKTTHWLNSCFFCPGEHSCGESVA